MRVGDFQRHNASMWLNDEMSCNFMQMSIVAKRRLSLDHNSDRWKFFMEVFAWTKTNQLWNETHYVIASESFKPSHDEIHMM